MQLQSLTLKGQVTLRKSLRDHLGVRAGQRVQFVKLPNKRIELRAATSEVHDQQGLESFFGCLADKIPKRDKPVTIQEMNEAIAEGWASIDRRHTQTKKTAQ